MAELYPLATGDFFEVTTYTTRPDVYKAPELVQEFDVRCVTTTRRGELLALGLARWESDDEDDETPVSMTIKDWKGADWYLLPGEAT